MIPICIATVRGAGLPVLLESIRQYAPEHPVYLRGPQAVIEKFDAHLKIFGKPRNFGEDYNQVIFAALKDYDEVLVANDDIVLTPDSVRLLMEDVGIIKTMNSVRPGPGWVASRSDAARPAQNVRNREGDETLNFYKYPSEGLIRVAQEVSPIFAWVSKDAFGEGFPPLNWYSDDVHCQDARRRGYVHFISASYVHHIGSNTIGFNAQKLHDEAMPWLKEHRPEYVAAWFGA